MWVDHKGDGLDYRSEYRGGEGASVVAGDWIAVSLRVG